MFKSNHLCGLPTLLLKCSGQLAFSTEHLGICRIETVMVQSIVYIKKHFLYLKEIFSSLPCASIRKRILQVLMQRKPGFTSYFKLWFIIGDSLTQS